MFADISVVGFNGKESKTFTYKYSDLDLNTGDLVKVKFANRKSIGIVRNPNTDKPKASIKLQSIEEKLSIEPIAEHLLDLGDWLIEYYSANASSVWQLLIPKNPTTKPRKDFSKDKYKIEPLVELTDAQQSALESINQANRPILLEGAMGSGKTEIYFHLIEQALKKNKSVVLMMPEIFLTKQMIERAKKHFGSSLIITHSSMTPAKRRAIWVECSARSKSEGLVVLGPRSALFSPLHNLGLIIIDEFHEQSYKQDSSPRYQTEIVAGKLASITKSKLVLGSATPSINTKFLADAGKVERVHMPERAMNSQHPDIEIIKLSRGEIISSELKNQIETALKDHKMTLIYINRRGTAPVFKCNGCGQNFECPHCGVNLHFHADNMKLVCHVCGYNTQPPGKCPTCGGTELRGYGIGTKAVAEEMSKLFPEARIARIDTDSAAQKNFEETLERISKAQVDIIIGTQMIGRGMDIANLELVGMINADYDLLSIDYNSLERAFQLLTQTAGRAGRRDIKGKVIIQTSQPDNPIFDLIINNNFDKFYLQELEQRKKYSYPPYVYLLKLECGFVTPNLGKQKSLDLINNLKNIKSIAVLGPVPSHPAIRGKKYMWSLVIKSKDRKVLLDISKSLEQYWTINLDPFGIS
jgi:primosomal protein N' (replication factor Y)